MPPACRYPNSTAHIAPLVTIEYRHIDQVHGRVSDYYQRARKHRAVIRTVVALLLSASIPG